jgi:acyl-CoA synthetase (AMP-forming)/AMP-acid ligase II
VNIGRIPAKTASLEPQREALVDVPNERRITFGELDERVRRLANALRDDLGLSKGDRVAILSKNCIQYMEVFYGAARCGLIALPLNWRLSDVELLRLLEDGEPRVIVVSAEYREMAERLRQKIHIDHWFIFEDQPEDNYERLIAAASSDEPTAAAQVSADDPVLILYTGGTTGLSKGALHTHHSLYMGMINQTVAERIVPTDVYMLTGQMFHIPVALAMNYMAHGCPVVLINFEAKLALEVIQRERVSAFLGITTMINWMMAVEGFSDYDLSSLRNFQYGGGPYAPFRGRGGDESVPLHSNSRLRSDRGYDHDFSDSRRSYRRFAWASWRTP